MNNNSTTRREFLALMSALGFAGIGTTSCARQEMPSRLIPGTDEWLPIIGLGSSKPVAQIAERGTEQLSAVLHALVTNGGSVVDTWPRNAANDEAFGRVINEPEFRDTLFIASKIDKVGRDAGMQQLRDTQRLYQREVLDLLQVFSLTDLDTQWQTLMEGREAGAIRYIGVTVANENLYEPLERFLGREKPDFVQINYSITERRAEERMLPMLQDLGIGVIINRPFMNGDYFRKLGNHPLPDWAAAFHCQSWAQFSLKYILPHPAITCVLTETSNPAHMAENALAAFGRMPDESERRRMAAVIDNT